MRLVAVSSVVRAAALGSPTGFLRVLDLDSKRILFCGFPPDSRFARDDPNPRGGMRGAKGISCDPERAAIAVSDRIRTFDSSWRELGEFTHAWFGQLHGILAEPNGIWVTATACDMLVKMSWEGEVIDSWFWRDDAGLRNALGLDHLPPFDAGRDYRDPLATGGSFDTVHLNAVARSARGLLVSFGLIRARRTLRRQRRERLLVRPLEAIPLARPLLRAVRRRRLESPPDHGTDGMPLPHHSSALIELPDPPGVEDARNGRIARIVHSRNDVGVPNHDVLEAGDRLLYNDSNSNDVVALDGEGSELARVHLPGRSGFVRGLAWLGGDLFLVGNQRPAAIYLVDIAAGRILFSIPLDGPPSETVSDIELLPGSFAAPDRIPGFESVPVGAAAVRQ
jgi:hypothetical protein